MMAFGATSTISTTITYVMLSALPFLMKWNLNLVSFFKKVKAAWHSKHKHWFYGYAKPNKCDPSTVIKYIGRYLGRPVIATSRIDSYDGDSITFHYNRYEDHKYVVETIPTIDFIRRLIRHIPEKILG